MISEEVSNGPDQQVRAVCLASSGIEELMGDGEADGEFDVERVGDSVKGGKAGGNAAAFESGDRGRGTHPTNG